MQSPICQSVAHAYFSYYYSKEPETKLVSSIGQQELFTEYSMYLRPNFKTFTQFISCHLILQQSEGQESPSTSQKRSKASTPWSDPASY